MSTHEYPKEMIDPGADAPVAPERLRSFVERMEWSGWGYDQAGEGKPKCPDCGNWQDDGHAEGCGLAALLAAPVAPAEPTEGWVLVPKRMTQEMRDVTDSEGWTWEDLLAEAGSISQEEYAAIAAAPVAPTEWTDAKLRGIASDYFPDRAHWPAAMLCLRHLLMEQSKFGATVAPVDHDEFSLFRNDLCDFLRHVIDMGKGDHYWDVVRGNAGALLRRVARIAPAVAPVAPAGDKPAMSEPVGYHDKHQPNGIAWCPGYPDALKDIAPLYAAAPPDAQRDAERLHWLREWLVRHGLLHALFCQPEAGMKAGDFWVLRKPYIVNGDGCEGYGKTEDEAIDAAMAAKEPT